MVKLLCRWENYNEDKHGNHYPENRNNFFSLVLSVDGIIRKDALIVLRNLNQLIA